MRNIGLFLGAGFSKWAANLPLVTELFDFDISYIRKNDEFWISKLKSVKSEWDERNIGFSNELFVQHVLDSKGVRLKQYLSKYLTRRLSEPFLCKTLTGIQTFMYNDRRAKELESTSKIQNFLSKYQNKIKGIVSLNYDLVVEYALGTD